MSSTSLEIKTSLLLESAMDFREHWLAHFTAVVDAEIAAAGGRDADGYKAVGLKLEKSKDTIYQHYKCKSGKVFPTVEMMVMLEKKYGEGRAVGWSSLPPSRPLRADALSAQLGDVARPSVTTEALQAMDASLKDLAGRLDALSEDHRVEVADRFRTLALSPDSAKALEAFKSALSLPSAAGEIPAVEQARRTGTN